MVNTVNTVFHCCDNVLEGYFKKTGCRISPKHEMSRLKFALWGETFGKIQVNEGQRRSIFSRNFGAAPWPIFQNCEGLLGWDVCNWAWWHKRVNMSSSTRFFFNGSLVFFVCVSVFEFANGIFEVCNAVILSVISSTPFSASNLEHRYRPAAWCKMGENVDFLSGRMDVF